MVLTSAASCVQVLGGDNPYNEEEPGGAGGMASAVGSGGTGGAGGYAGGSSSSSTGGGGGAGGGGVSCTPGETRPCYAGPAGTEGVGNCKAGVETCGDDGMAWGICANEVMPEPVEDCAIVGDEDCDGIDGCTGAPLEAFTPAGETMGSMDEAIYDVAITPDGGYVVAGVVKTALGGDFFGLTGGAAYVAKIGADGALVWEKDFPSTVAIARGVAVSNTGDVVLLGEFTGTVNFGGNDLVTPDQSGDIFLVKLDAAGAHVWSERYGATGTQSGQDVAVDDAGNVYITGGVYADPVSLGGATVDPFYDDVFVASYGPTGNHRWSHIFVNNGEQRGRRIVVTPDGSRVAIIGATDDDTNLGGGEMPDGMGEDVVVGVYNGADGTHAWSKLFGGNGDQRYGSVAFAPNGNVLVTGRFSEAIDFGGGAMMAPMGTTSMYVAELAAADGGHLRSRRFGITGTTRGTAIAADDAGNVVVVGHFDGTVDFGGAVVTASGWDVFVAKFSPENWTHLWTRQLGGQGNQFGWNMAIDAKGNAVVGGGFYDQLVVGAPLPIVTSTGGADLFAVRLSP
ncbi:hypothetical protein GF068_30260 [Polyangium spumosum]|uniref:Uncharacterized protein n=1 Tax=Polyangium spumosum TaxID=889282 RepID=A0A6N7Q1P6_9BACT|nr:hypothetical protein [Polyangium spumosum]